MCNFFFNQMCLWIFYISCVDFQGSKLPALDDSYTSIIHFHLSWATTILLMESEKEKNCFFTNFQLPLANKTSDVKMGQINAKFTSKEQIICKCYNVLKISFKISIANSRVAAGKAVWNRAQDAWSLIYHQFYRCFHCVRDDIILRFLDVLIWDVLFNWMIMNYDIVQAFLKELLL